MLQQFYRGLTHLGGPVIRCYLDRRRAAGREDSERQGERLGVPSRPRPSGPLVWCHGASVGEANAILILIKRLLVLQPTLNILVTTGTVTSAQLMARRLPPQAIHQYYPVDRPGYVASFLDHWRPDLALWIESELWPNMLWEIGTRRIAAALINGRMSDGSFRRWRRVPGFIGPLLAAFRIALAQTGPDARRLEGLGAQKVQTVGNLKFSADPLPADPGLLEPLSAACRNRPVWLFASSHPGEDEIAAEVHRALAGRMPGLLTMIAPRHPHRGAEIVRMLREQGLPAVQRSAGALPAAGDAVYVADTIGELGVLFRLAPVVCVGGSLVPHGGQNPIEPAQLGCAILYGPHMRNFATIAAELEAAGAALPVADGPALAEAALRLLNDEPARRRLAEAAASVTARHRDVADRMLDLLQPLFVEAGIPVPA